MALRLTIRNKVLLAFLGVVAFLAISAGITVTELNANQERMASLHQNGLAAAHTLSQCRALAFRVNEARLLMGYASSQAEAAKLRVSMLFDEGKLMRLLAETEQTPGLSQAEKAKLSEFTLKWRDYSTSLLSGAGISEPQSSLSSSPRAATEQTNAVFESTIASLDALISLHAERGRVVYDESQTSSRNAISFVLFLAIVGSAAGIVTAIMSWRGVGGAMDTISQEVRHFTDVHLASIVNEIEVIASGDLRKRAQMPHVPDMPHRNGLGELSLAFEQMIDLINPARKRLAGVVDQFREVMVQVSHNAVTVGEKSDQLADSASKTAQATLRIFDTIQDVAKGVGEQTSGLAETASAIEQLSTVIDQIAKGAQQQASNIEQTSNTVNQMSRVIDQVAVNAQTVSNVSAKASDAAGSGAQTVERSAQGMKHISVTVTDAAAKIRELGQHSAEIGRIVEVIDDIAEQTNLLALNAAIEAARAGEQGRGFAVVADEVRKLAERSGRATKEISQLIASVQRGTEEAVRAMEDAANEVQVDSELAVEARRALEDILKAVQATNDQIQSISVSAEQMTASSIEVVKAMDNVSSVVEENTAATEQIAASSARVSKVIEDVAQLSRRSSAAAQEVAVSTESIAIHAEQVVASAQALSGLAAALESSVKHFITDSAKEAPGSVVLGVPDREPASNIVFGKEVNASCRA
ncbi:MAG: methyl-accepting chemotaxis protein [Chloroflexota bacterium]